MSQNTEQGAAPAAGGQQRGYAPQGGYAQGGYGPQGGAPQGGYAQGGYGPPGGAPQGGYGQGGYGPQGGTPQGGYAQGGYAQGGAPQGGYGAPQASTGYGQPAAGQAPGPGGYPPAGGPQSGWQARPAGTGRGPGSSALSFDAKRWSPADMVAGVASLVVLISLFLPWFTASLTGYGSGSASGSVSGTGQHGWLWVVFVIALLIMGYLVLKAAFQTLPFTLPMRDELLLLIAAGVNLVLVVVGFVTKPSVPAIYSSHVHVGWGIGAFLGLAAAVVAVAPLVMALRTSASASRPG